MWDVCQERIVSSVSEVVSRRCERLSFQREHGCVRYQAATPKKPHGLGQNRARVFDLPSTDAFHSSPSETKLMVADWPVLWGLVWCVVLLGNSASSLRSPQTDGLGFAAFKLEP